ncbi:MAG: hypothetical protein QM752_05845 [Gammaproteobacteria bacterium]
MKRIFICTCAVLLSFPVAWAKPVHHPHKTTVSHQHSGSRAHHHSKAAHQGYGDLNPPQNLSEQSIEVPINTAAPAPVSGHQYFKWARNVGQGIAALARRTIQTLHYTNYSLGGSHYDPNRGVYVLDCSDYVDNLINQATPHAYSNLVYNTGTDKPTTADYYNFFNRLPNAANNSGWHKVSDVRQVQAGDILVFRYKSNRHRYAAGGHVMVVMNAPVRSNNVFLVQVADSAVSGHSQDTRPPHASGIGIGTLLLKVDPHTEQLAAYSWKMGAPWKDNVSFAIGRPISA